ncbi:aldose 1-epimerase family protein [Bacillus sp. EB106-08-02-XG196]|uniref:aldose 1-epimerase family protein n=1 Tax=Bacillus sp. EB106-08-02-XG196 TaxID=2737049 RepID=UPI0015C477CF|nr:aldose 1-epimerase family protein [Bacillus sp. EB106-08-02-XG196]NWQ44371.1 aldose 1-epimerase family protein [Bacillus sp. EB106-08-02-XG196]
MPTGMIELQRDYFTENSKIIFRNEEMTASLFSYPSGVEAIELKNSLGGMVVLPYLGQMIWDLEFDNTDLKMKNMFSQPKKTASIIDTYGCFAFHSGLIRNGCPEPEDDHGLHGEMPCADMDRAWLEINDEGIKICGEAEYVKGFGHHYLARPSVKMFNRETFIEISMKVKNLSGTEMPLQYMCHTNYAYVENAVMKQNIPDSAFKLRESVPGHVKPTGQWMIYNKKLICGDERIAALNKPEMYDPEIVFFADKLNQYQEEAEFEMVLPDGTAFFTRFSTAELNYATRWILHNRDQQVGAFVLPATCRPEGFLAAERSGTLLKLESGEERSFTVVTGKK